MGTESPLKGAIAWCGRLLLGITFSYAAISKIVDPRAFASAIDHYRLLSYPFISIFAIYLPWLELICAASVLFRWRDRAALLLITTMCLCFSVALASAWWRGLDTNCGCFGSDNSTALPVALVRSLTLGFIAFLLFRMETPRNAGFPPN